MADAATYTTLGPTGTVAHSDLLPHLLGRRGPSGYGSATTAEEVAHDWQGAGKVVVITGSNTGLGKEAARVLASRGAEVVIAVRNTQLGEAAAAGIRAAHPGAKVDVMACDLSSLASVRRFVADFTSSGRPCHAAILNAGVMACPFETTAEGHELQFGTNHLGHFALATGLLPVLRRSGAAGGGEARVVVLSSAAHFNTYAAKDGGPMRLDAIDSPDGYNKWAAYGQSKLANVLFARELDRRLRAEGAPVLAVACHPGVIFTELGRHVERSMNPVLGRLLKGALGWSFKSIPQGAATEVYLATAPGITGGEYYADCNLSPSTPASHDAALGRRLWELSERLVAQAAQA